MHVIHVLQVGKGLFRGAQGAVVVFALNDRTSF